MSTNVGRPPCWYFHKGTCRFGTACRFRHDSAPLFPVPSLSPPLSPTNVRYAFDYAEGTDSRSSGTSSTVSGPGSPVSAYLTSDFLRSFYLSMKPPDDASDAAPLPRSKSLGASRTFSTDEPRVRDARSGSVELESLGWVSTVRAADNKSPDLREHEHDHDHSSTSPPPGAAASPPSSASSTTSLPAVDHGLATSSNRISDLTNAFVAMDASDETTRGGGSSGGCGGAEPNGWMSPKRRSSRSRSRRNKGGVAGERRAHSGPPLTTDEAPSAPSAADGRTSTGSDSVASNRSSTQAADRDHESQPTKEDDPAASRPRLTRRRSSRGRRNKRSDQLTTEERPGGATSPPQSPPLSPTTAGAMVRARLAQSAAD